MLQKTKGLNETQIEVFDLLVGFEEEEQLSRKKLASRRALRARRAIEQHIEEKELSSHIDECWIDDD
ncbi:MAG: PA3496 family putative envelope integrity protein [Neptuniibacter sp.]